MKKAGLKVIMVDQSFPQTILDLSENLWINLKVIELAIPGTSYYYGAISAG